MYRIRAEQVVNLFQEAAYPVVYPNPFDVRAVLSQMLDITDLETGQRELIEVARVSHLERMETLSVAMVDEYLAWHALFEQQSGFDPAAHEQYSARMIKLQSQRKAAALDAIQVASAALSAEQLQLVRNELASIEARVEKYEEEHARKGDKNIRWPDPTE